MAIGDSQRQRETGAMLNKWLEYADSVPPERLVKPVEGMNWSVPYHNRSRYPCLGSSV